MTSVRVARERCMEVGETRRRGFPVGPLCVMRRFACLCAKHLIQVLKWTQRMELMATFSREQEARNRAWGTPSMWSTEALVSMGAVSKVQNVCKVVPPCDDQGRFAELVFDDGEEQFALWVRIFFIWARWSSCQGLRSGEPCNGLCSRGGNITNVTDRRKSPRPQNSQRHRWLASLAWLGRARVSTTGVAPCSQLPWDQWWTRLHARRNSEERSGQWRVGGFHGMLLLSAKHSRSPVWWEDTLRKAVRNAIQRTSNTVWSSGRISPFFLPKTCRDSTNSVRKSYLEWSSVMCCMRGESGKETFWSQTLKNWSRWTHLESTPEGSMQRKCERQWEVTISPVADGTVKKNPDEISVWEHPP